MSQSSLVNFMESFSSVVMVLFQYFKTVMDTVLEFNYVHLLKCLVLTFHLVSPSGPNKILWDKRTNSPFVLPQTALSLRRLGRWICPVSCMWICSQKPVWFL